MKKHDENTISHEDLCAYVLGEAAPELRERVEQALEGDDGLRAEHDALAATIGLVQTTCAGDQALAPEILSTLESAARPAPRPNPWYASTPVRMAAGITALAAGVIAGRAMLQDQDRGESTRLARLEERPADVPADHRAARKVNPSVDSGAEPAGQLSDFDVQVAQGATALPIESAEVVDELRGRLKQVEGGDVALALEAKTGMEGARAQGEQDPGALYSLGGEPEDRFTSNLSVLKVDSIELPQVVMEDAADAPAANSHSELTVNVPGAGRSLDGKSTPTPYRGGGGGAYKGAGDIVPPTAGGQPDSTLTASDDFFLGRNSGSKPKDSSNTKNGEAGRARVRTKAKKSMSGPSTPAPSGPSSPGPSSPGPAAKRSYSTSGLVTAPPAREADKRVDAAGLPSLDSGEPVVHYEGLDVDFERADTRTSLGLEPHDSYGWDSGRYRQLTPAQVDELCKHRVSRILQDCRRHGNERPRDMFFRYWGDNAFELARLDKLSTFSVDVDTASYALARRYLAEGTLPEKAQVRTEEFLNYFKPDVAAPTEETFAVHTDLTPSRFGADPSSTNQRYMMRVVVRGKEIAREERKPLALTFVVDTSGSMKEGGRLELVKHSLRLLASQLDGNDSLSIVAFSNEARLVLPMTSAANRGVIEAAVYGLHPDGGTNAEAGLKMGYEVAATALSNQVHNRVVLLSDGVANIGQTDQDRVNADVKARRDSGIFLNTIGVGMNNHNDTFLEQLANKGDGLCNYIDTAVEARRALVENFTGAFEPIARDVKIQVEFDDAQVYRYRLLGYENRAIADADFRNDAVDAGEVGAGHQVVALYELELTGSQVEGPMAQVHLRWKAPTGAGRDPREDSATERSFPVSVESLSTWDGSSDGYKRSALVAQFAEFLRRSVHARNDSLDELIGESVKLAQLMKDPDFDEFVAMLQKSRELIIQHTPRRDTLTMCVDSIRRNHILRAQYEELRQTENRQVIEELERQNLELEARIAELIRGEIEQRMK